MWKSQLDWYHKALVDIVKPWLRSVTEIRFIFFGIYGPRNYELEDIQEYERLIMPPPEGRFDYIWLRAYVPENRQSAKSALISNIQNSGALLWDYELLKQYRVRDDLGNRYG